MSVIAFERMYVCIYVRFLSNRNQKSFCPRILNARIYFSGECLCDNIETEAFAAQGAKALIDWVKPTLKCASGRQAKLDSEVVEPPVSPPHEFGVGHHTVTYTYRYMRGTKVVPQKCSLIVDVNGMYHENSISDLCALN